LNPLYLPTGLNSLFYQPSSGLFSDYLNHCREIIVQGRQKTGFHSNQTASDYVCPFEWSAGSEKYGILMLHGLLESPFLTRDMAQYFYDRHYLIRSLLLPGHGTGPGDLLTIQAEEWQKSCHYGIQKMVEDDRLDGFYILAVSTGATLTLLSTCRQMIPKLKGIILVSPAFRSQLDGHSENSAVKHVSKYVKNLQCALQGKHY